MHSELLEALFLFIIIIISEIYYSSWGHWIWGIIWHVSFTCIYLFRESYSSLNFDALFYFSLSMFWGSLFETCIRLYLFSCELFKPWHIWFYFKPITLPIETDQIDLNPVWGVDFIFPTSFDISPLLCSFHLFQACKLRSYTYVYWGIFANATKLFALIFS